MLRRMQVRETDEGAAAVELALLTMLIVPMVVYTVYVGEAFITGIKAQEAEISAGWEITAFRLHAYNGGSSASNLLSGAANDAATRVKNNLIDFNSFQNGGSTTGAKGVWGDSTLQELNCAPRTSLTGFAGRFATDYLHSDGWVGCQAKVQFENKRAPVQAHGEFFGNKIIQDSFKQMVMCGSGRTLKGCDSTNRGFVVFTDDWGLENPAQERVGDYGNGNPHYYNVGAAIYDFGTMLPQAQLVATFLAMVGAAEQGETSRFKMGYMRTIRDRRNVPSDGSAMRLHLSPQHENPSGANTQSRDLSETVYANQRTRDHYLGEPDENWNKQ